MESTFSFNRKSCDGAGVSLCKGFLLAAVSASKEVQDEMNELMKGNNGLASRMPYVIEFPNYTREQLCQIYFKMLGNSFEYDEDFQSAVTEYFNSISDETLSAKDFSNARFVRNLFERTCAKASMRMQLSGVLEEDLKLIALCEQETNTALQKI